MIINQQSVEPHIINETSSRKILGMGGTLMMVEVTFSKGGVGEVHSHDAHEQVSYIVKGSFEVQVGDETRILKAGDSFYLKLECASWCKGAGGCGHTGCVYTVSSGFP